MTLLSLDCLTLTDTSPADLIRSAAAAGFDLVSLWVNRPAPYPRQVLTPEKVSACAALFADTGVGVHNVEAFDLVSEAAVGACRLALETGARLGAKAALVFHHSNTDRTEVIDALASFVELADSFGLGVNLEPIAMGQTRTLAEAQDLIREAGVDAGILYDTYHLMRSGGRPEDVAAIEPGLIRYVQINDGLATIASEDMLAETVGERLYPGKGAFPLVELLASAPTDIPWAIETPSLRRTRAGVTPEMQAQEAMAALQRLLSAIALRPA